MLAHDSTLDRWIGRYLLVFNCLMSGDVEGARQWYSKLGKPEEPQHAPLAARLTAMLTRVQTLTGSSRLDDAPPPADPRAPLGSQDLRGWHFALNGTVLTTLSPFGFSDGMTGRYAFLNETYAGCHHGLHRLRVALDAAGHRPSAVALLPDRSSRVLGLAAARLLDLPARELDAGRRRRPGGRLHPGRYRYRRRYRYRTRRRAEVRARPAAVRARDLLDRPAGRRGRRHHSARPGGQQPWETHRRPAPGGGGWTTVPADERPDAELVAEVLAASPLPPDGDGQTPDDRRRRADGLRHDRRGAVAHGPTPRDKVWSPGPVRSSRFW